MDRSNNPNIVLLDISRLNQYSHDYTLPAEVEELLCRIQRLLANDGTDAALRLVSEARMKLQKYLSQDNMLLDDDCADPWVRYPDIINESKTQRL